MTIRSAAALSLVLMFSAACGMLGGGAASEPRPAAPPPEPFIDRVWRVVDAPPEVPAGTLYVFLSDNSMLVTPSGGTTPILGRWHEAGGGLVLIEAGFRFPADILEQGRDRFAIRIRRAGRLVDVKMELATAVTGQ